MESVFELRTRVNWCRYVISKVHTQTVVQPAVLGTLYKPHNEILYYIRKFITILYALSVRPLTATSFMILVGEPSNRLPWSCSLQSLLLIRVVHPHRLRFYRFATVQSSITPLDDKENWYVCACGLTLACDVMCAVFIRRAGKEVLCLKVNIVTSARRVRQTSCPEPHYIHVFSSERTHKCIQSSRTVGRVMFALLCTVYVFIHFIHSR